MSMTYYNELVLVGGVGRGGLVRGTDKLYKNIEVLGEDLTAWKTKGETPLARYVGGGRLLKTFILIGQEVQLGSSCPIRMSH